MSVIKRAIEALGLRRKPDFDLLDGLAAPESLKQERIWGVVTRRETYHDINTDALKKVNIAKVVANTTSFHPNAVLGNSLTYDEAQAIVKIHNSGAPHGTD
jgi:hypothetical protein